MSSYNSVVISAHKNPISQLTLNKTGSILATTSDKGTLIRLFNTKTGDQLHELRRGSEPATIQNIAFEIDSGKYLTCCSNKETIHIFKSEQIVEKNQNNQAITNTGNTRSYFSPLSMFVAYAGSEWSFAQLKVQGENNISVSQVKGDIIMVAAMDGNLHLAQIPEKGGVV